MKPDVIVVGGGAVGVCCALELRRRGAQVQLLERGPALASGCSAGNAGLVCPSHSIPISNPKSLRSGMRYMWKKDSPFYLRPRVSVLPWLARYTLAARRWEHGSHLIQSLSVPSLALHARLGEELGTSFEQTGTLSVYATEAGFEAAAREGEKSGLNFSVLDADETRALEPSITGPVVGGVHYPDEGRVDPKAFVETVGKAAAAAGVEIKTGVEVFELEELDAETIVVAAGAWSRDLVDLPLEGGKGYHVDFEYADGDPKIPAWLQETLTVATPLPGRLRLSGTLELAGLDLSISQPRVDAIRRGGDRWFQGLVGRPVADTWAGLRPCLPDGLPAIGRLDGVIVATGHAMKGVALSPITGRLVAQLVAGEQPDVDLTPFDPARF